MTVEIHLDDLRRRAAILNLGDRVSALEAGAARIPLLESKVSQLMTRQEQVDTALATISAGLSNIAADIQTLQEQLANKTVSDESLALLDSLAQRTQALSEVVPDAPPAEPTA